MIQWFVLFQKEMIELWRNRKWVWLPLALILIAILDPISTYYLPQIIEMSGGLPEGAVLDIPVPSPEDLVMMILEQLNLFGLLIIILISIGTIAGERQRGVTQLILVKPITYTNYITAKWAAYVLLTFISLMLALSTGFYYVIVLFDHISLDLLIKTSLFYFVFFIFILTLSIFYNTFCKSQSLVASLTILTVIIMTIINSLFGHKLKYFPNRLTEHIHTMLHTGTVSNELLITTLITLGLSLILLILSIFIFKRVEKTF